VDLNNRDRIMEVKMEVLVSKVGVLVSKVGVLVSKVVILVSKVVVLANKVVVLANKGVDLEIKEGDNQVEVSSLEVHLLDNRMDKILVEQLQIASPVGDNKEALILKVEEVTRVGLPLLLRCY
jgi:hypothetical protein